MIPANPNLERVMAQPKLPAYVWEFVCPDGKAIIMADDSESARAELTRLFNGCFEPKGYKLSAVIAAAVYPFVNK